MKKTSKVTDRRTLRFARITDLTEDVDKLCEAGSVRSTGNWTPAQIVTHVTSLIRMSIDDFTFKAPLVLRIIGPMIRSRVLNRPMGAGINLRGGAAAALIPDPSVTWEHAVAELHKQVERIESGTRMTRPSPIFGKLEHEEWTQLHCRHAEMHFSFMAAG